MNDHQRWIDTDGQRGRRAIMSGWYLSRAHLAQANLNGADLRKVNLSNANLHGARLICSDLREANLMYTNLTDADLRGALNEGSRGLPVGLPGNKTSNWNLGPEGPAGG